ncbi:MAG TPA: hypothetical protein VGA52_01295 [Anaerolineales bacterium]
MTQRTKGNLAILAAFIVLFSAMLDPRASAAIAVAALIALAIFEYRTAR